VKLGEARNTSFSQLSLSSYAIFPERLFYQTFFERIFLDINEAPKGSSCHLEVGMKMDRIRTDITGIIFVFIFLVIFEFNG
jgi:hypothetical protein